MSRTINYKEKYEKALERARVYWETDNDNTLDIKAKGTMEHLFPELAELGDESIRKRIIALVNAHGQGRFKESMLAWLEKVDKDNKFLKSIKVDDILVKSPDGILINLGQSDRALEYHDKVEPKFKVGDWITWEEINTAIIVNVDNDKYEVEFIDGNKAFPHIEYVDRKFHLWSIEDAKEGDILANNKVICIYKERVSEHVIKVLINYSIREDVETHYDVIGDFNLYPVTKQQRDFFFSKLKSEQGL